MTSINWLHLQSRVCTSVHMHIESASILCFLQFCQIMFSNHCSNLQCFFSPCLAFSLLPRCLLWYFLWPGSPAPHLLSFPLHALPPLMAVLYAFFPDLLVLVACPVWFESAGLTNFILSCRTTTIQKNYSCHNPDRQ